MLSTLAVENYRSLHSLVMPLSQLTVRSTQLWVISHSRELVRRLEMTLFRWQLTGSGQSVARLATPCTAFDRYQFALPDIKLSIFHHTPFVVIVLT